MPEATGFEGGPAAQSDDDTHDDYQKQRILLQRQNKKRLAMARQDKDDSGHGEINAPWAGTSMSETSEDRTLWPESCRFFDPYTMDANFLNSLLWQDSLYFGDEETTSARRRLSCVSFDDAEHCVVRRPIYNPSFQALSQWLSDTSSTKIVYVGVKRKYFHKSTQSAIKLLCQEWIQLLCSLEILPSALELLHDNNGGFSSRVTGHHAHGSSPTVAKDDSVSASHVSLKLGDSWPNHEHFFYARYDFRDERHVFLIAGTGSRALCDQLCERLSTVKRCDIFCVLVFMLSLWLNQAEDNRWRLDYEVQDIESRTGFSSMQYRQYEPLTPEQMSLTKDMAQTAESIALLIVYMENMIKSIIFAKEQHLRFYDICCKHVQSYDPPSPVSQLQDALAQYHSQACSKKLQMQMLQARVAAQIAVTNTLIAHRDSRANIELAKAMNADSKLMRGIAFVTMIFLPATFLATFFSMTFFHLGGSDGNPTFEVSKWIWLYPLCTVPLTLVLAFQYGLDVELRKFVQKTLDKLPPNFPRTASDSEAQAPYARQENDADVEEWANGFADNAERKQKAQST